MAEQQQDIIAEFKDMGYLQGHNDWVTQIAVGFPQKEGEDSPIVISSSRDKSIIMWNLYNNDEADDEVKQCGYAHKALKGHNHFVSDIALSHDNLFLISSSWDKTLRLWDLRTCKATRIFVGHTKEVYSCAFSPDNRQIISAGADRGIKLWNTLADCKFTSESNNHTDWVSCIRYSPSFKSQTKTTFQPYFASVGWDGRLKVWNTNFQIRYTFKAHEGNANSVSISPNGKYLATGGKDKILNIWDINDLNEPLRQFEAGSTINQISFNPKLQWVSAATENGIRIWDLMSTNEKPIADLNAEIRNKEAKNKRTKVVPCTSLAWNSVGKRLFAGFTDGLIRVWNVNTDQK